MKICPEKPTRLYSRLKRWKLKIAVLGWFGFHRQQTKERRKKKSFSFNLELVKANNHQSDKDRNLCGLWFFLHSFVNDLMAGR